MIGGRVFGGGVFPYLQQGALLNQITPEYQLVLDAMVVKPDNQIISIHNTLVKTLVLGGVWSKLEWFNFRKTPSNANGEAQLNWINPVQSVELINSPLYEILAGFTGNGVDSYINTKFNATTASKATLNDTCIFIYKSNIGISGRNDLGGFATNGITMATHITAQNTLTYNRLNNAKTSTDVIQEPSVYTGLWILNRKASNNFDIWQNDIKMATKPISSTSRYNGDIYELAVNPASSFSTAQHCLFGAGKSLTDEEISILSTAVATCITALDNLKNATKVIATSDLSTRQEISLTTYDGSGETVHPSVVNIGSQWNGYQYWMANTPYPNSNPDFENPSIWASNDGVTWVVPAGLTNPVVPATELTNADTDLFYENNKLYMLWADKQINAISMLESSDGITWDNKQVIYSNVAPNILLSPSLIKIGTKYFIYGYSYTYKKIMRISCDTINGTYANQRAVVSHNDIAGKVWWHLSVKLINNIIYIVAMSSVESTAGTAIYIHKSTDGLIFKRNTLPTVESGDSEFMPDFNGLYRPTIELIGSDYYVYYGRRSSPTNKWGVSRIKINLL